MHQIEIIGSPIACKDGIKETWRDVADWTAGQLKSHYGDQVRVRYYDLFEPNLPAIPVYGALPIVLIDGLVISRGTKISIPLIRKKIQELDAVLLEAVNRYKTT